ncbi:glutathione S-transferase family protein [Hyphococcus lacteus]|uniref:Glutathione S-transferase family protein n=1 Tax=Hyphococcus lacteus TaxID=3143536 RepID=A0ABV3Z5D7_9PROT
MNEFVVKTYDWVPETPRGYVRDLRVCWALEEAGLSYRVESVPFQDRGKEHFEHHPFGQVPWLEDGDFSIFESGAIVFYIAERSQKLMPKDPQGRAKVTQWIFAALNSVEMAALPYSIYKFVNDQEETPGRQALDAFLTSRLENMDRYLENREWLVGDFTAADILMADVLRLVHRFDGLADYPLCRAYVDRATARPAFIAVHTNQLAHFAAADH